MAKINFYLKDKNAKAETLIYVFLSADSKRYKVSTGQSIHPRHWNPGKQKAKNSLPGQEAFNNDLVRIEETLKEAYNAARAIATPINTLLLKEAIKPAEETTEPLVSFWDVYAQFYQEAEITKASNTMKNYRACRMHLKRFTKDTKFSISFEVIDMAFANRFESYLITNRKSSQSTIAKQFSVIKNFMEWARQRGHHKNLAYKDFKFKSAPTTKISLTEAEVFALSSLDLSKNPSLERVRDMFLFCCETSLRYSDLANLKPVNLITVEANGHPVKCLSLAMVKTRGKVTSPLSEEALELLDKYVDDGPRKRKTCFPIISGQKMNDYIKVVAQLVGIDAAIQTVKHIGSKRIEKTQPKYELITNHTARRTFVTTCVNWGWTDQQIMVYTGHKSSREIQTYRDKSDVNLVGTALSAPRPNKIRMEKVG